MTEQEQKLLIALVKMVSQYLTEYGDEVDSISQSAGEHALQVLADFGLTETLNTRFGRWTEEGSGSGVRWPEFPIGKQRATPMSCSCVA